MKTKGVGFTSAFTKLSTGQVEDMLNVFVDYRGNVVKRPRFKTFRAYMNWLHKLNNEYRRRKTKGTFTIELPMSP